MTTDSGELKRAVFLCAALAGAAAAADPLETFVTERVLPWDGVQTASAAVAEREIDAMDAACDRAWCALETKAAYDAYRLELKRKMTEAVGVLPPRTPLNARTVATFRRDGYRIEKVIFESMPGLFVTANLFLPDAAGPVPGVVMSCGHAEAGKDAPVYLRACVIAVKHGFAALMFDPHHQGERRTSARPNSTRAHTQMGLRGELLDWSAPLLRIWDGLRAIDYLLSRREVDPARLGYMGQSGGGTMTALLQAVDARIKAAAPSCFLTSLRALCRAMGPQDGEQNIFGQLAFGLNHTGYVLIPDIPVAVTAKFADMFPYDGVRTLMETVRTLETKTGIGPRTFLNCSPGPHGWSEASETASVLFLARHLKPDARATDIDLEELWQLDLGFSLAHADLGLAEIERGCTADRSTARLPGSRSIYDIIADKARLARAARAPSDAAGRRAAVRRLARIVSPSEARCRVKETFAGEFDGWTVARVAVQTPRTGHLLPAVFLSKAGATGVPLLVAAWNGRREGLRLARAALAQGRPVLLADLTGVGEIGRERHFFYGRTDRPDEGLGVMSYLMGRPLVGRRATDLLVLADVLSKRCGGRRCALLASGPLAVAAAHAFAAEPSVWAEVSIENAPASWRTVLEGGDAEKTDLTYAELVPRAYFVYDWTDLLDADAIEAPRPQP